MKLHQKDECFHCLTHKSLNIHVLLFIHKHIYNGQIIKSREVKTKIQKHSSGIKSIVISEQKKKKNKKREESIGIYIWKTR